MRSSVSAILSDPAPDTTMSFPDYGQTAADHARLLVLCQQVGHQLPAEQFQAAVAALRGVAEVRVADKSGAVRPVRVRYTERYPAENNEWGEFQSHRRVLGLVTVGQCGGGQQELAELGRLHEATRAKYSSTVYDTRCVVFCSGQQSPGPATNGETGAVEEEGGERPASWVQAQTGRARLLQYSQKEFTCSLQQDIQDFISSLFWILESKRVEAARDTADKIPLLCAPFERKDFVGLDMESRNNRKRVLGRLKKHLADVSLQAGLLAEAWNYYQVAADVLRPANDWLWLAASLEGLCAVSVCLQEQQQRGHSLGARGLSDQEMVERYREAVIHYGKYKHAGIIETEASIKAVQVLIKQRNFLLAAEFLQNIVFINLQMNDAEKIARFLALSDLYSQIGFTRKAAFFKRVAAMRCVAPQNPQHDWAACYELMLAAVPGYAVELDLAAAPERGWPALQVQLLQELVGTSRKMGAHPASTRHMTFLLQHMFPVLSDAERQDFSAQLSVLSGRAGAAPDPVSLHTRLVLPPVPLTCLPGLTRLAPLPLPPHLAPAPARSAAPPTGPFLFTPIQMLGVGPRGSGRGGRVPAVSWVEGEVGEVVLHLRNPLGVELTVPGLALITEGVEVEAVPAAPVLPARSQQELQLRLTPRQAGSLNLLGWRHNVLGVESHCLLSPPPPPVTILPALPRLAAVLEAEAGEGWRPVPAPLPLHTGQAVRLRLTLTNCGRVEVGQLCLEAALEGGATAPLVEVDEKAIPAGLPLLPGASLEVGVVVTGAREPEGGLGRSGGEECGSEASEGRWSASLAGSVRSPGQPSLASLALSASSEPPLPSPPCLLSLRLQYTGEQGGAWCRKAVVEVGLQQLASLQVQRWDVLPGDTQHNCFLVLDLVNRTSAEMELSYAERKTLLIEPADMCRVPVPVTKCSFSESLEWEAGGRGVAEYLAGSVRLAWSIQAQEEGREVTRRGVAGLEGIHWTDTMLDLIRRPPLVAAVLVAGQQVGEGGEVEHQAGEVVQVEVRLSNQLLEPVTDCQLTIQLEQEGGAGAGRGAAGIAGSPGATRPGELLPGETISHATSLLPLSPGTFKLVVSASVKFRERPHAWTLAPLTLTVMTEPEPVADPYRALLKISVSSLCTELGYTSAEAAALETLTELTQSFVTELGRSARAFTELAGRVEPVSADILLALLEMGVGVAGLHNYAQRIGRLTVPTPAQLTAAKNTAILHTGNSKKHPAHVPDSLPDMPDSHSYIRTPTHRQPVTDYELVREKAASQKRDVERALTRFIAKTGKIHNLFKTEDSNLFPLISCSREEEAAKLPPYLDALLFKDQVFEEDEREYLPKKRKNTDRDFDDDDEKDKDKKAKLDESIAEEIDNPFLRPVRMPRIVKTPK